MRLRTTFLWIAALNVVPGCTRHTIPEVIMKRTISVLGLHRRRPTKV
jgi:hypothetical protein